MTVLDSNKKTGRLLFIDNKSKDGTNTSQFDAVDFIASLASHIPNGRADDKVFWLL